LYAGFFGHSLQKRAIQREVAGLSLVTGRYVLTEVRNQAAMFIDLYFIISAQLTIDDAAAFISSLPLQRRLQRGLILVGSMVGSGATKPEWLAAAANIIMGYVEYCEDQISEIIDRELGCPLAIVSFSREPGLTTAELLDRFRRLITCVIDEPPKCGSDKFRSADSYKIELVRTDSALSSKGAKKIQEFLNRLAPHGRLEHARGLKDRCSKIGDLIIALQCPPGTKILTLDTAYVDLGRILKRDTQLIPSLQTLARAV
jgi:hypothetical protein